MTRGQAPDSNLHEETRQQDNVAPTVDNNKITASAAPCHNSKAALTTMLVAVGFDLSCSPSPTMKFDVANWTHPGHLTYQRKDPGAAASGFTDATPCRRGAYLYTHS